MYQLRFTARYLGLFKRLSSLQWNSQFTTVSSSLVDHQNSSNEILSDKHGRFHNYLRISLTERCNLRCNYCMPEEGVTLTENAELLSKQEMIYLAQLFIKEGVDKIRLTGGEPLVRKDIVDVCYQLNSIGGLKSLGITTNGIVGKRKLSLLSEAGLTHVNISLDTLIPQKFEFISRRKGWSHVINSIDIALDLPFKSVKVNCVVMKGLNDEEILPFVEFTKEKDLEVRFIEYMPFDGNKWNFEKFVPFDEIMRKIQEVYPDIYKTQDEANNTSKCYKIPGFKGRIGFITSMSKNFCSSCNRLRLTADGNLKACLFGPMEVSLRDSMRNGASEAELLDIISTAVKKKKERHAVIPETHYKRNTLALRKHRMLQLPFLQTQQQQQIFSRNFHEEASSSTLNRVSTDGESTLTHVSKDGAVKMVDVGEKVDTHRTARASSKVRLNHDIITAIKNNLTRKGDVLTVAKIAGIMGAKDTSKLIPLCHNIPLSSVTVDITVNKDSVDVSAVAKTTGKTGVEMEALTAVTVASLTVYDMCKAMSQDIVIDNVRLERKTGGKTPFDRKNHREKK